MLRGRSRPGKRSRIRSEYFAKAIEALENRWMLALTVTGHDFAPVETVSSSPIVATFTDTNPSAAEDYSANINWGDSTIDVGVSVNDAGGGTYSVSAPHTYAEDGTYPVVTTIFENNGADKDTGSAAATATVSEGFFSLSAGSTISA